MEALLLKVLAIASVLLTLYADQPPKEGEQPCDVPEVGTAQLTPHSGVSASLPSTDGK